MEWRRIRAPADWEPYVDELRTKYIDQGWTLTRLMDHMKTTHRLNARY